jgi:hypothetical protein
MATDRNPLSATPPEWAEYLLRMAVARADFESIAGDLLEEYRDSVQPAHGQPAADWWYVKQVSGYVLRTTGFWGVLFGAAFLLRTALDWLVPTSDFQARSAASTAVGVGLLSIVGFLAARRSGSFAAGPVAGVATAGVGALVSVVGAGALLAVVHDPATLAAIRGSGGLGEVFTLPFAMILPGVLFGSAGGALGVALRGQS